MIAEEKKIKKVLTKKVDFFSIISYIVLKQTATKQKREDFRCQKLGRGKISPSGKT